MLTRNKEQFNQRLDFVKQMRCITSAYAISPFPLDRHSSDVIHDIGNGTRGIVIHNRFVSADNLRVLVECTLLKAEGKPCDVNKNVLFEVEPVEQFILRSKGNVIISQLVWVDGTNELIQNHTTTNNILSQMSNMSQISQPFGCMETSGGDYGAMIDFSSGII